VNFHTAVFATQAARSVDPVGRCWAKRIFESIGAVPVLTLSKRRTLLKHLRTNRRWVGGWTHEGSSLCRTPWRWARRRLHQELPDADSRAHASRAASPLPPPQVDGGRIRAWGGFPRSVLPRARWSKTKPLLRPDDRLIAREKTHGAGHEGGFPPAARHCACVSRTSATVFSSFLRRRIFCPLSE
jgi:hypothetical protein